MPSTYDAYRATKHFASLDALRGVAVSAVVWHHTAGASQTAPLLQRGFLGVDLFFVLSGFLIVTLLLRERDDRGEISLARFYARRTLRIAPVYYGLLLALGVFWGVLRPDAATASAFVAKLPYYLTYTSNWLPDATVLAVAWSLAAEEQFYLVWPPLEKLLRPRAVLALLAGFVCLNQLVNFDVGFEHWPAWLRRGGGELEILQITFTPICLGVALAHALHSPRGFTLFRTLVGHGVGQVAAAAGLLAAASWPGILSGGPRLVVQLSLMLLLASCVVREGHALRPLAQFAPLRRLGIVSYGIYLYHLLLLPSATWLLQQAGLDARVLTFATCLALAYVVAELSFRFYETPFLQWKSRLAARNSELPTYGLAVHP